MIMSSGLIGLSTRTFRSVAPSSTWAASYLHPSSAAFITTIAESSFQYTHEMSPDRPTHARKGIALGRFRARRPYAGSAGSWGVRDHGSSQALWGLGGRQGGLI